MSSDTRERPESGSIEEVPLSEVVIDLTTYVSDLDGATVVEIGTSMLPTPRRLRVYVNEGVVFDQDPEQPGPHGECGYTWHTATGPHRCGVIGRHPGRSHVCRGCQILGPL